MSPEEIARRRLATRGLSGPRFESPVEVVRWLGAVQSQEYRSAKWSLAQRTARPGEGAGPDLQHVEIDGETCWSGDEPRDVREPPGTAHLLQAYDEYIGYGPSRHVYDLAGLDQRSLVPESFTHVVVIDGQVAARWRYAPGSNGARIEWCGVRAPPPPEERSRTGAVARYARFAGAEVDAVRAKPR